MEENKIPEKNTTPSAETMVQIPKSTLIIGGVAAFCAILAVLFLALWLGAKNNAPTNQNGDGNSNVGNNGNQSEEKPDEISVSSDGYLVVNGVKTDYQIKTDDIVEIVPDQTAQ